MTSSRHFDCLVVGGGLIGMLTARELARSGLTVGLVERSETGRESTWAGGGILSPLYPWRYPEAVTALASWSQARYAKLAEDLITESGIDPEFQQNGLLILDSDEATQAQQWADRHAHCAGIGPEWFDGRTGGTGRNRARIHLGRRRHTVTPVPLALPGRGDSAGELEPGSLCKIG